MNSPLFNDRRAAGLLDRVRQDVSHLRDDIGNLLSHATKRTLPNSAREFADQAKHQFASGGAYAASRFRDIRGHPQRQSAEWIGGALVVGILAYGIYAFCRSGCASQCRDADEYDPENENPG